MKKQTFTTQIAVGDRGGAGIYIPFNVKDVFGSARAKVKVTVDKHIYRTTTAVMSGKYVIPLRKEIREAIGKDIGEQVKVIIEPDTEERIVVVPDDFTKALAKNKNTNLIFSNFAYTHRKEYVRWIESAKKLETRIKRIEKAIEMISNNKKFS
jgi:hypothetical protein